MFFLERATFERLFKKFAPLAHRQNLLVRFVMTLIIGAERNVCVIGHVWNHWIGVVTNVCKNKRIMSNLKSVYRFAGWTRLSERQHRCSWVVHGNAPMDLLSPFVEQSGDVPS